VSGSTRVTLDAFGAGARTVLGALARELGPRRPAWIVGGAVRDALSGAGARDLDIAVPSGAVALARETAGRLGAAFLVLDEARGAARMVSAPGYAWQGPQVDFADFRAPDLAADLRGRDFTVNALGVSLAELVGSGEAVVQDPTGGARDLRARVVRLAGPRSLEDDPVRVLRAARLAIMPGWSLDGAVGPAAERAVPGLTRVSAERVRDELLGMLGEPVSAAGLRRLDEWGAMAVLLPERSAMKETPQSEPHRFDVWEHSLRAVEAADLLAGRPRDLEPGGEALAAHLDESLGDGATRREALKLAALLHDIAKPETRTVEGGRVRFLSHDVIGAQRVVVVAARMRLSGRLGSVLERLVRHHLRPMHLAIAGAVTRRARYRLFRDLGDDALDLLLLAVADASALRGDSPFRIWEGPDGRVVRELMAGHAEEEAALSSPALLNGREVMEALGLGPGPELGRLLALLREAQAVGTVSTREAAIAYLRRLRPGTLDTSEPAP
jgi:putative nucleotidyltransferase with HDIG domain